MTHLSAVLSGDLIASRKSSSQVIDATMAALAHACERWAALHQTELRFTRHRGDGWQVMVHDGRSAFDVYLMLVAHLVSTPSALTTKVSIGFGQIDHIGTQDLSDATGSAFFASGDLLDHLNATRRLAISGEAIGPWQHAPTAMIDWIVQSWTQLQAEAIALRFLRPDLTSNSKRADFLDITRQAYEARFNGSGFTALDDIRHAFRHDLVRDLS